MRYKIGQEIDIPIYDERPDFDSACRFAKEYALTIFGADDCGHLTYVEGHERSTDSLEIKFVGLTMHGGMTGWQHTYQFKGKVVRNDDE